MSDMRNQLIHGYWNVNLRVVWDTVLEDMPSLRKRLSEHRENDRIL